MKSLTRPTRGAIWGLSAVVLCLLVFKLFEPLFTFAFGWQQLPQISQPAVETHDNWSNISEQTSAWLVSAQTTLNAPAISAAVSIDGELVWTGGIGFADIDAGIQVTPESVFRIGSTSKAVTSIAMGLLIDQKAIDLDVPVSVYIPDLPQSLATVTTRQVMSHTAGVRNYGLCLCFPIWESLSRKHYTGHQRDVLRPYENDALLFEPGSEFSYTSLGYNITGVLIESVSGDSLDQYLDRKVFQPLDMRFTRIDTAMDIDSNTVFYEVENDRYKKSFRVNNTNKLVSGGILSTPSDMVKLGAEMIRPVLISLETRDALMTPQPLSDGSSNPQGYALGWRYQSTSQIFDGEITTPRLHHHGTAQGSTSYFAVLPEYGIVVSVMMNKGQTNLQALGEQANLLTEIFVGEIMARPGA